MQRSSNPVEKDDCGAPLYSTYWPERALNDTDTVNVHSAVTPITGKLILTANPRTRPSTMQRSSNPVERDDCGVPLFSTYWSERAQINTSSGQIYIHSATPTLMLSWDSNYAMVNGMPTILDAFGNTSCLQMHLEVHLERRCKCD